jgi:hypothetical protein
MKSKIAATISLVLFLVATSTAWAIQPGDFITIITPGTKARLCPIPSCGLNNQIARIPKGHMLRVEKTMVVNSGMATATWCLVTYNGQKGWVSNHDTDKD